MTTEHDSRAPLLGDKHGKYRILIVGNSGTPSSITYIFSSKYPKRAGTGKSTLSSILSTKLGIKHCSLDKLFWNPGWQETPVPEFRALVQEAMDDSPEGWIIDGNYTKFVGTMVQDQATDIIWLDPPFLLYFPRILVRTIKRWWGVQDLCSPGCGETFRAIFLSRKSILAYCVENHFVVRRRCEDMIRTIGIGIGPDPERNCMRRVGGWGGALRRWLRDVDGMVCKKL